MKKQIWDRLEKEIEIFLKTNNQSVTIDTIYNEVIFKRINVFLKHIINIFMSGYKKDKKRLQFFSFLINEVSSKNDLENMNSKFQYCEDNLPNYRGYLEQNRLTNYFFLSLRSEESCEIKIISTILMHDLKLILQKIFRHFENYQDMLSYFKDNDTDKLKSKYVKKTDKYVFYEGNNTVFDENFFKHVFDLIFEKTIASNSFLSKYILSYDEDEYINERKFVDETWNLTTENHLFLDAEFNPEEIGKNFGSFLRNNIKNTKNSNNYRNRIYILLDVRKSFEAFCQFYIEKMKAQESNDNLVSKIDEDLFMKLHFVSSDFRKLINENFIFLNYICSLIYLTKKNCEIHIFFSDFKQYESENCLKQKDFLVSRYKKFSQDLKSNCNNSDEDESKLLAEINLRFKNEYKMLFGITMRGMLNSKEDFTFDNKIIIYS
ncbi:hypothetical protein LUQ84_000899 [Hamiltosporidium tvaerminnensis]|nr:hypothetical protein LUQ84_000899 [Hamiltosporidium tvaerminnensis]